MATAAVKKAPIVVQRRTGHSFHRTTKLYDRTADEVHAAELERIRYG
jgi:hypothetical protein